MKGKKNIRKPNSQFSMNSEFPSIIHDIYTLKFNIIYFIIIKLSLISQNF